MVVFKDCTQLCIIPLRLDFADPFIQTIFTICFDTSENVRKNCTKRNLALFLKCRYHVKDMSSRLIFWAEWKLVKSYDCLRLL